jgi:hypothetical protein
MKDILSKLGQLEETFVSEAKQVLNESTEVTEKKSSLKDMFESIAGMKPIPVVGKEGGTQQTGAGFVNITDPSLQGLGKTLGDLAAQKKLQIVMPTAGQASGTPAPAGATGQQPAGQQQMKEKWAGDTELNPAKKGMFKGKTKTDLQKQLAALHKSGPHKKGSPEYTKQQELNFAIRAKSGWKESVEVQEAKAMQANIRGPSKLSPKDAIRDIIDFAKKNGYSIESDQFTGEDNKPIPNKYVYSFKNKKLGLEFYAMPLSNRGLVEIGPIEMTMLNEFNFTPARAVEAVKYVHEKMQSSDADDVDPMKYFMQAKGAKLTTETLTKKTTPGKVIKDFEKSKAPQFKGKSKEKRKEMALGAYYGMHPEKSTKKVKEADIPSTQGIDTKGAGLGAGRSQTTLESKKVNEAMNTLEAAFHEGKSHGLGSHAPSCRYNEGSQERHRYFEGYKQGLDECYGMGVYEDAPPATIHGMDDAAMDEGNAFTAALARTPKGGTFKLGGKSFTDHSGYNAVLDEYTFESLDKQLNALLNEGLSVSISKGNPGAPDSVSVSATDQEADSLLAFVKQSGLGISGDDASAPSSYGFPAQGGRSEVNSPGGIEVVDDHDGMMSLMKKLAGVQASAAEDYADEEGECEECGHNPCGCNDEEEMSEETCNECGMLEAQCGCSSGGKEMVDEVESEDQMAYEVAEDNAPDNGSANSMNATKGNDAANMALAVADQKENVAEDDEEDKDEDFFHNPNVPRDQQLKAPPKEINVKESFMDLYKKLAFLSEESTAEKDEKAEKAGKKVAKDIEYDEGHKGKDDNRAEKAGKKVTKNIEYDDKKDKKEKVDEWANKAGPGNTVSDTTFEQDIDFMTKVISGGLNKPKATGQTTVPVIAHQGVRTGIPQDTASDLKKLAGIK